MTGLYSFCVKVLLRFTASWLHTSVLSDSQVWMTVYAQRSVLEQSLNGQRIRIDLTWMFSIIGNTSDSGFQARKTRRSVNISKTVSKSISARTLIFWPVSTKRPAKLLIWQLSMHIPPSLWPWCKTHLTWWNQKSERISFQFVDCGQNLLTSTCTYYNR